MSLFVCRNTSVLERMQKNAQQLSLRGCVPLFGESPPAWAVHRGAGAGRALWGERAQLNPQQARLVCDAVPVPCSLAGAKCT